MDEKIRPKCIAGHCSAFTKYLAAVTTGIHSEDACGIQERIRGSREQNGGYRGGVSIMQDEWELGV